MKKLIPVCLTAFSLLLIGAQQSFGQGCSDAGFCTMGAMKPSQIYSKKINFKLRSVEFSYGRAQTTLTPTITAATVDLAFGINEKTSFQLKLPYYWVDGNLGNTSGLSDISYSFTRNMYSTESFHINATLGGKIPTNNSDIDSEVNSEFLTDGREASGLSTDLPMYYQTSLGSVDIVAGASFISKKWMFATGIQIALTENQNDFRWDQWGNYPDINYLQDNNLANNLKRGTDIMFRVERAFHFSKWDFRVGALPIFRITKDEILDIIPGSPTEGQRIKVENTIGLALTAIGNVAYHFNTNNSVALLYGIQITDRKTNPDGLTRDNVLSLSYVVRF